MKTLGFIFHLNGHLETREVPIHVCPARSPLRGFRIEIWNWHGSPLSSSFLFGTSLGHSNISMVGTLPGPVPRHFWVLYERIRILIETIRTYQDRSNNYQVSSLLFSPTCHVIRRSEDCPNWRLFQIFQNHGRSEKGISTPKTLWRTFIFIFLYIIYSKSLIIWCFSQFSLGFPRIFPSFRCHFFSISVAERPRCSAGLCAAATLRALVGASDGWAQMAAPLHLQLPPKALYPSALVPWAFFRSGFLVLWWLEVDDLF